VAFLKDQQGTIDSWLDDKAEQERTCFAQRRWFTHEQQEDVLAARPTVDPAVLRSRLKKPGVAIRLGPAAQAIERSLAAWEADHRPAWAALNAAHVERELVASKDLLDRVESKPLTPEQARAVVCFDNRVQVVASAGSGKTSTMVAKAAYAIQRGFVDPKRIVLLAFNKQAAEELKERLIGKATGEKPDIPDWATDGRPRSAASGTCSASSLAKTSRPLVSGSQRRCGTPRARQASAPDGACDSDHL